ncbi:type VI secretion system lipoprotein TssJ [Burkholderia sp. 9775_39]|uniref:type VI secretion system lipoprotein TssJ n=1 Tax=unclassified Burkholderia TaxID=2613784 RepID=UPI0018C3879D|nr:MULTISPECIES: type VI secretion system lipoprotein TssJ [unclassified Burkholderia]MBG0881260.1 type VI secretion system lipoprotein TssJ [Burkholderia sp. 9775_39]MBG0887663.1 type VI secretion system lipoprotein TssJ [Burkholderia sp. 9773_38]
MSVHVTFSILVGILMLQGCGAWQSVSDASSNAYHAVFFKKIKVLKVDLSAREALNLDEAGHATSVAVRVYQLKNRKMFDAVSYNDLLKDDRTILSEDLQASAAAVVSPGASVSLSQPMQADTKFVAIVAFYRAPGSGERWKYIIDKERLDVQKPLKLELVDQLLLVDDVTAVSPR